MMNAGAIDIGYLMVAFCVPLAVQIVTLPRLKASLAAGIPGMRVRSFQRALALQWMLLLPIFWIWRSHGRSWSSLGITLPMSGAHAYGSLVIVALTACFYAVQVRGIGRIVASPDERAKHRERIKRGGLNLVMPKTEQEYRWMIALSVTAGICEELFWRGYATWLLGLYIGLPLGCAISAGLFGVAHFYQGTKGIVRTTMIGGVMSAIVLLAGSLVPAMLLHAIGDMTSAKYGYIVCREDNPGALE